MRVLLGLTILLAAVVSGCAALGAGGESTGAAAPRGVQPDLPLVEGMPDYAYRSATALEGYRIAVLERDLLARLPCYCGCGQDEKFRNLRDCFLDEDGRFNPHGANCGVCQEEARDAAAWKREGLSIKEIRDRIDREYEGRGKPTDTPPVME